MRLSFLPAVAVVRAVLALLVLARALVGDDAEVVVGELEVVFLGHAVAVQMRVVRHLAILLEQLRRIAARPAVDAILVAPALLAVAATAATIVAIVIQGKTLPS